MSRGIGSPIIGRASPNCNNCIKSTCFLPMTFTGNMTNNHYFHSGNRNSWSRHMRANGGNGKNGTQTGGNRPGINRLGGPLKSN